MTTASDIKPTWADIPARRRRPWLWLSLGLVFALVATGVIVGVTYAHTYQPLVSGATSGPATRSIEAISDGLEETNWVLVGDTGTVGTVNYLIQNTGRFSVRILGLNRPESIGITGLRWAPLQGPNGTGEGYEAGLLRESRPLPVTLAPKNQILIQVTVTKPKCPSSGFEDIAGVPIRWSAFGVDHTWDLHLTVADFLDMPIDLCPSTSVIAHIDRR